MWFIRVGRVLTALGFIFAALQPAHALPVTVTISGIVTSAAADNPFDLQIGDALTGSVTFDSDLLGGVGFEVLRPETDPSLRLEIRLGGLIAHESDDRDFPEFPRLDFLNGQIFDLSFVVDVDDLTAFVMNGGEFGFVGSDNDFFIEGIFSFAAVPEPGTLALFGLGLAGIGLLRRRHA